MKTCILGVNYDVVDRNQALQKLTTALQKNEKCFVVTPNPEIVMMAQNDNELMEILNNADLVVADGIGIVLASRLNKLKLPERVAGYDLTQDLLQYASQNNVSVYFLGAAPGVAEQAKKNMCEKFIGLNVVGTHDGYFENDSIILDEIKQLKPDILLVGLGAPKQEKWLHKYKQNFKVCIGIGGSFDVMSGNIKRAPKLLQKFGFEWFYRLLCQPKRIGRIFQLPLFVFKVLLNKK